MPGVAEMIGGILVAAGSFFFLVGAIGIYRMPDVFTRMHAAGISDTVGAGLLLLGMMMFAGFSLVAVKLAIILGVILFTSPIATHALAQAALHDRVEPLLATKRVLAGPGVGPPAEPKRSARRRAEAPSARVKRPSKRKGKRGGRSSKR